MENGGPYVVDVTKSEFSGESVISTENVLASESTNTNVADDDLNDVKVCDICGDVGYEEVLVICSECNEGAEHIYCMQTLREAVPEGDWFCDDCKSKHMDRDPRQPVAESQTPSSLTHDTMKQVINDSTDLKISDSGKSKLSSDKIEVQKNAQTSAVPSNRQIGVTNEAPENKKQANECLSVLVDESQSLLQSNSSSKLQETIRADNCGGLTETKITQRPSYSRDGPMKVSVAGKSNGCAAALLANNNSLPRSLSRDNSFKTSETAKVKFLPTHTVASLCSGTTMRGSTKSTGVDGKSDMTSPRTGMINSHQMSCRGNSIAMTDSTGHPVNRSGHRPSFRQSSAYSSLQSAGLSKSGDAFPSFLLSNRNTNLSRVHSTLKNNKVVGSDNGLSELAGNSTGSVRTTRSNNSRICAPSNSNYSMGSQIISSKNVEICSTLNHSAHIIPISSKVEKSITDISASPSVLEVIGSTAEEVITVAKENSHLALAFVEEKTSAVVCEVIQPQKLGSEELKGSAMAKQSVEGFPSTNKDVEDILTHHTNDMDLVKEDSCWMKPVKGGVDVCDLSHNNNLYTSVVVEEDGLTSPLLSTRRESSMEDRAVSNVLKDQFPKVDNSSLIKEPTMSTLSNKDNKAPGITILKDIFTSRVKDDTIQPASNKKTAAGYLDKQPNEELAQQDSKSSDPTILKDNFTCTVVDDTILSDSNKKSAACHLDKRPYEDQGISDSSADTSNEADVKPINEFCKDPYCNGGSLETGTLRTASNVFVRADLVVMQGDKLATQPTEKNISPFVVMPPRMLNPSARTNFSVYSSKNYDTRETLQGTLGSTQQMLGTWPESDFLWRGGFQVNDRISGCQIYDGIQAHPSNKASQKVYEVSRKFPPQLLLEQVRRSDAWPIRFTESPPTDEDIALYIFPINMKSCQIRYSELLETTIKQDLALRVHLDCAELLIFSSNQLPHSYHRYKGEMYLWGVFRRRKIPSADSEQPFPDNSNVGGRFAQVNPRAVLVKSNPTHRQLYAKGCNEGEEDMDVNMEGGREIGMADGPTPRTESPIALSIDSNVMQAVALSNFKPLLRHHNNYSSGDCMPSEQGGHSSNSTLSNSGEDLGKSPEGEEDMDVDMEGGREIGIAEIPTPRPQLANVAGNKSMQSFILPNSKPILTQLENSRSSSCMPIENGGLPLVALWAGSGMNLGKASEHMSRTEYVKDAERTKIRSSPDNPYNEPDFPPGFEVQRSFYHSHVITRNGSGMNIEAMPEKSNILGTHGKLQQRELPHVLLLPKDMYSSDRSLFRGFSLHGQNCPTSSMLDPEFPPGLEPPGMKPLVSPPEYTPGLKMASMKTAISSSECPPGLEPTCMNPPVSNPPCRPGIGSPPVKPLVSEVECPPGLEAASVKPLASSPDYLSSLELACVKTLESCPDSARGLKSLVKPLASCPDSARGLKSLVKPLSSSPDCPPCVESSVGNPNLFSVHSCGTETAKIIPALSSSECMPGLETASGNSSKTFLDYPLGSASAARKSIVTASDQSLENSALKQQVQDKSHRLLPIKVESSSQRCTYLSPGKEDRSRNHSKLDHASDSRGVKRSYSFASLTREDGDRKAAKMSKSKSFREELYNNRHSSREKEDWRERSRSTNEKDYNRRTGRSSREKDHREEEGRREAPKKYGRENEGKKGSGNYSREEEDKRKRDKRYTEEEHAGDRYRRHHRYWDMHSAPRRHKDQEKHPSSFSRHRTQSELTTHSDSPSRGKYRRDSTRKMVSGHRANSSHSDSSIEHNCDKRPSLNKDSKNADKVPMVCLHDEKAIMEMDSAQVPRSEHCSLENKDNGNIESGEILAGDDHILLCDHDDDVACSRGVPEENNLGATSQQAMEVNLSGKLSRDEDQILLGVVNDKIAQQLRVPDENNNGKTASQEASGVNLSGKVSADHDHILLCDQNDDAACSLRVPEETDLGATSQQAMEVNLSGKMSADHDHILLCDQNDDSACSLGVPEENKPGATSQQATEFKLSGKAAGDKDQILSGVVNDKIAHQLRVPDENINGETASQEALGVNLSGKLSADHDHIILCDLNDEATCSHGILEEKNLAGIAFHGPTEVNVADPINSRPRYVSLLSEQGEQHRTPVESNSSADSRLTIHDSVKCLQLFPMKGDSGVAETTTNHLDFKLQLGLEHWTPSKEPLPLLEQSSWQSRSLTFMFDNGASSSGSKSVCDDSREASPPLGSILSLSMPRYRKHGNTWIPVQEESEVSEETDADVKLTLSMF